LFTNYIYKHSFTIKEDFVTVNLLNMTELVSLKQ